MAAPVVTTATHKATRVAYGETLAKMGETYPDLVVLDADLSVSTMTTYFAKKFPERFFQMGISEQDMICTAAGLALSGKKVFASSFAIFATGRAWEQVRNSVAYPQIPLVIAATHSGVSLGEDGGSHQSVEDIAIMRTIPGMRVLVPSDALETQVICEQLISKPFTNPTYLRLGRLALPFVHDNADEVVWEKPAVMASSEKDAVAIIATGLMVAKAVEAWDILNKKGISARIIKVTQIKPLSAADLLAVMGDINTVITAEEHNIIGGLGSAVAELLAAEPKPYRVIRHGVNDVFGQSGKGEELLKYYHLDASDIANLVSDIVK